MFTFGIKSAGGNTFFVTLIQYIIIDMPTIKIKKINTEPAIKITIEYLPN